MEYLSSDKIAIIDLTSSEITEEDLAGRNGARKDRGGGSHDSSL